MGINTALEQYKKIGAHGNTEGADCHRLIQMLLEGALEKIVTAKGCMERKDIAGKGANISASISIVDGLQSSLDRKKGGEIGENLFQLYQYIMQQLIKANINDSSEYLDESFKLLSTIKSGWDGIEKEAKEIIKARGDKL